MPIFGQKMSILSKLHYIMGQKVNRIPLFFPNFHDKILLSCPYFIKKRPFSNKHTVLTPIFCQKNVHSLKNSVLASFFSKVSWKTPAVMPIFDQQTSILSKLAYYMSQKSQWDAPFSNYHEKMTALMSVFCQKNVNSLKNIALMPIFYQKTFSQKHDDPISFFSLK